MDRHVGDSRHEYHIEQGDQNVDNRITTAGRDVKGGYESHSHSPGGAFVATKTKRERGERYRDKAIERKRVARYSHMRV